ncbi:unnamed protein product [Echinostoma caproni]|uniref:G_PROTEIN_RECEP_F1_2 domain-containing protein n=1 Tax=Echinostoma caproni TaxID=27848 RepID=A0A183AAJ3_9TREM|nr:unnamed protein product [Echinostoma caproni]
MPLAEFSQLVGSWPLGEAICDMYIAFDVLLCTASILNLCAISIDRYLAIIRPLQYAAKRTPKRMMLMIAIVWLASALISIPPMFGFKETFVPGRCEYSSNIIYQIYATCGAFYIPLIVMIVLYGRIFMLARHMAHEDAKQKRVTDSVANQSSSVYTNRNGGRPSTVLSDDFKMLGDQNDMYDGTGTELPNQRNSPNQLFRRSQSQESKTTKSVVERYPLPPSELCRRRKPRPLHRNTINECQAQAAEFYLEEQPTAPSQSKSTVRHIDIPLTNRDSISTEPKSPSGLSCAEEFEERVKTMRKLRAEFFAAPPSRHCSSVILNLNRESSASRESGVRPLTNTNTENTGTDGVEPSQQHRSPLHHSQTMREPPTALLLDYKPQPRSSMPPPPKLSISYYSEDPSMIASPSQVSDAMTTWTIVEQDRDQSSNPVHSRPGNQPIPRPRPRPLHGARRSVTNAADYANKDYSARHSLLGLPCRGHHDRRSSSPLSSEPFGWNNSPISGANGRGSETGHLGPGHKQDSPDHRPSYLERSTSRLFHRTSDHTLNPPTRSRAPSWASIRVPLRKRRARGHSETKAIKTLGVIMGCFCLCWVPFFIIAIRYTCLVRNYTRENQTVVLCSTEGEKTPKQRVSNGDRSQNQPRNRNYTFMNSLAKDYWADVKFLLTKTNLETGKDPSKKHLSVPLQIVFRHGQRS